jgi:hypothetical protein
MRETQGNFSHHLTAFGASKNPKRPLTQDNLIDFEIKRPEGASVDVLVARMI